jgi:hypothetical protein
MKELLAHYILGIPAIIQLIRLDLRVKIQKSIMYILRVLYGFKLLFPILMFAKRMTVTDFIISW